MIRLRHSAWRATALLLVAGWLLVAGGCVPGRLSARAETSADTQAAHDLADQEAADVGDDNTPLGPDQLDEDASLADLPDGEPGDLSDSSLSDAGDTFLQDQSADGAETSRDDTIDDTEDTSEVGDLVAETDISGGVDLDTENALDSDQSDATTTDIADDAQATCLELTPPNPSANYSCVPSSVTVLTELKNSGCFGESWLGGDDAPPRNLGIGQRFFTTQSMRLTQFAFYFAGAFDNRKNPTGAGHAVTLVFTLRNASGMPLTWSTTSVDNSFSGGWVYWTTSHSLAAATEYIVTVHVKSGADLNLGATAVLDQQPGAAGRGVVGSGGDLATWSNWSAIDSDFLHFMVGVASVSENAPIQPTLSPSSIWLDVGNWQDTNWTANQSILLDKNSWVTRYGMWIKQGFHADYVPENHPPEGYVFLLQLRSIDGSVIYQRTTKPVPYQSIPQGQYAYFYFDYPLCAGTYIFSVGVLDPPLNHHLHPERTDGPDEYTGGEGCINALVGDPAAWNPQGCTFDVHFSLQRAVD